MPGETIDIIRKANREIRAFVTRTPLPAAGTPSPIPEGLSAVAEAVEQAWQSLAAGRFNPNLEGSAKAELTEYTENLQRLRDALEKLQTDLTGRRSDLQTRLARAQATLAWVASLKQTVERR